MLPILKNKQAQQAGVIVKTRAPDESQEPQDKDDPAAGIKACARELINAIHAKDEHKVSEALKDIFSILDSEPHEEGEHTNPHSYDAQNEDAAGDKY